MSGGLYLRDGERKYLTAGERERVLARVEGLNERERLFCLVMVMTGCRISEALGMRRGQVSVEEGVIAIRSLKKRRGDVVRRVPVPEALVRDLLRLDGDHLFPWGRTRGWQLVKQVLQDAGVREKQAMPRVLRHSFGVHAIRSAVPVHLVQRWLGHARVSTTAIYLDVVGEEEREMARRMW